MQNRQTAGAVFAGVDFHVPPKVVANDDLTKIYDTSDEWITERSGIKERRYIDKETGPAELALPAVKGALAQAGVGPGEIDMIVFATLSPEAWFPGSGCFLQELMDFGTIPALDIRMQCSGFIYALSVADQYIRNGACEHILVVGSEVQSTSLDPSPEGRMIGVLFGDGAGAAVLRRDADGERGVLSTHLHSDGRRARELWTPEPTAARAPKVTPGGKGLYPIMNGREVFRHAVARMSEAATEALEANGWAPDSVDLFVTHQANQRITEAVARQLGLPAERFYSNIARYGNTTSATIPICLAEAQAEGRLNTGDRVVLAAFGSGFAWASAAVVW